MRPGSKQLCMPCDAGQPPPVSNGSKDTAVTEETNVQMHGQQDRDGNKYGGSESGNGNKEAQKRLRC